ncbi:hypothetical protein FB562_0072 [Homoserinimonas aerilata]|uniref:Uncharacterized protein n=1 Tax=Homoserinimonas aerilata TaxID=1162970 RepID=A0A542YG29_9MICO|nr:hypothetical protein [Homoserinimonas aerilata]TQL47029.1 hypothetical protein FB562_0072 [Homoserinimonas aerilata]
MMSADSAPQPADPAQPRVGPPRWSARLSVVVVWVAAVVGAVLVLVFGVAGQHMVWFPIVLAVTVLLAFSLQLSLDSKEGLVDRLMASIVGAVVVLAVATGVLLLG